MENTLPSHLGSFILSISKRTLNNSRGKSTEFISIVYIYGDSGSLYIEKKWDVLDKANLVGEDLCQGKIDHKRGGIFYELFLAFEKIYC